MPLLLYLAVTLAVSDLPRLIPDVPKVPTPWVEQGNRRARRRQASNKAI